MISKDFKNLITAGQRVITLLCILSMVSCEDKKEDKNYVSGRVKDLSKEKNNNMQQKISAVQNAPKTIVFFGNSLTAGYGLELEEAYPALIQKKLDSANLNYLIVNAGVSGETSSSGKNRLDWILKQKVDIFVLELGANDGLRGLPVKVTKNNLTDIITAVKTQFPLSKIILAGMQIPPNMGKDYADDFNHIFKSIAAEQKIFLIPFLLEKVGGESGLNQEDGIHPTVEGQKIVAENVWKILKEII